MKIKDLEIISDDLLNCWPPNLPKEGFSVLLEKIPQKPEGLFIKPYKEFYIAANFSGEGWLVVLNSEVRKILDLIDNKRSVRGLYDLFLKSGSGKFGAQDIALFWEGKISAKDIFNKVISSQPLIKIDDFLKVLWVMKRVKLIHFPGNKEKRRHPEKRIEIWFHLTNQCNFRCKHCYVLKTPRVMEDKTAFLIVDKIFESAKRNGVKNITIKFAGGEPLLEFAKMKKVTDYIFNTCSHAVNSGINLSIMVLTNCSLVNDEFIKFVKEKNIKIAVSLDGIGEFHNGQRISTEGGGTFESVIKGIGKLMKNKVPFGIMTTVTSQNLPGLPVLADWLFEKHLRFKFTFVRKSPFINSDLVPKNEDIIEIISKIYKKAFLNPPRLPVAPMLINSIPHRYNSSFDGGCGVGKISVVFNERGEIFPCQTTVCQKDMKVGSVIKNHEIDLYSLINSPQVRAFNPPLKEKVGCKDCQWLYVCSGVCPISNFLCTGNAASSSYHCSIFKALIPQAINLEAERMIRYKRAD